MCTDIIKTIVIFIFFMSSSFANENYEFKFHKLKVKKHSQDRIEKIGIIRGNVEEYPYGFNYYADIKEDKLIELIETFYFENYGDHMSRFNNWARNVVYISNPNNGCNNSEDKIFHALVDNGPTHFNCFSIRKISGLEEVSGPNFNKVDHIPMGQRKAFLKKIFKKRNINLPKSIYRIEHYFYRAGKLTWIFYSIDSELFFKDYDDLIAKNIQIHKDFEQDLRYKNHMKIDFD